MTLLLLAGLLVTTMKLGLSSRQTTSDQARTLTAQYAAESSLAAARSRLRDIQTILSTSTGTAYLQVPAGLNSTQMRRYAEKFCQDRSVSAWTSTNEFISDDGNNLNDYPNARQCLYDSNGTPSAAQFDVLADFVTPAAYTLLPAAERPTGNLNQWWMATLSGRYGQRSRDGRRESSYQIRPVRVVQITQARYRFYLGVVDMQNKGKQGAADRALRGQRSTLSTWFFEVDASLNTDVLMTNHHRMRTSTYTYDAPPDVNFVSQVFDGSVHTNEKFLFLDRSSNAQFKGAVTSAGCRDLPLNGSTATGQCDAQAGVYVGGTKHVGSYQTVLPQLPPGVTFADASQGGGTPDFGAPYRPLPTNANDQREAARTGGLLLTNAGGIDLRVGDANGNLPTRYNTTTKKWEESTPAYQYIRVYKNSTRRSCEFVDKQIWSTTKTTDWYNTPSNLRGEGRNAQGQRVYWRNEYRCIIESTGEIDPDQQYRVDKDGNIQKLRNGRWQSTGTFNGVIYSDSLSKVTGPERLNSDLTGNLNQVPPALASFSQIMLAAENDIRIDTDLVMSDTPCSFTEYKDDTCTKRINPPTNVLGIYSQSGDVIFGRATRNNLNIHASLMTSEGQVTAENYDVRPQAGVVNMIGSLTENWYGAFGLVNSKGFGRNFTYDQRLKEGIVPPFAPISPNWSVRDARDLNVGDRLDDLLWAQVARP
ncbi:hypothetical protein [Deinococcus ficus]|uniref:hypothetical protein n=1 Tax=Deinococcus ficus TaxID=317577 RepID=UPI00174A2007|nr:hypothetical protein [Deinococcus ficus]GHF74839.1 hypothetical protein GCM10017782_10700 [Deinococcus ficus]